MSQDNIFREVDEELQRERMRTLWRRFGPYVIGAAVAVVLIVAINEGWAWWRNSTAASASDEYYAALKLADSGDVAGAQAELTKIEGQGGGYATLAKFKQAALLAKEGKQAEAVAAYDALAAAESNVRLRELALVLAGNILVDSGTLADVEQRVGSLNTPDSPMRNSAREAIGLAQYKAGDLAAAKATFESIMADPIAPRDLQSRADVYLGQIIAEGGAPADNVETDTPAPATETPAPAADAAPAAQAPAPAAESPAAAPAAETPAPAAEAPATDAANPLANSSSMMQMMAPAPTQAPAEQPAAPAATEPATPAEAPAAVN